MWRGSMHVRIQPCRESFRLSYCRHRQPVPDCDQAGYTRGRKVRAMLRARLGEDIYTSWFAAMEFESFDGRIVRVTVPVKFLKSWIQSHYADDLLDCCAEEFSGVERVDLALRQPGLAKRPRLRTVGASRSASRRRRSQVPRRAAWPCGPSRR